MSTFNGNPWASHGLIKTRILEHDYQAAEITTDEEGTPIGPRKDHTTSLFELLFDRVLFSGLHFFINSMIRPSPNSGRRSDVTLRTPSSDFERAPESRLFCFAAEDGARLDQAGLVALEDRATGFCTEYCRVEGVERLYVWTLVGRTMRCREYQSGVGLSPFWGGREDGIGAYKDVGKDEDEHAITECIARMELPSPE